VVVFRGFFFLRTFAQLMEKAFGVMMIRVLELSRCSWYSADDEIVQHYREGTNRGY